jgi:hypothetical protein
MEDPKIQYGDSYKRLAAAGIVGTIILVLAIIFLK